MADVVEWGSGDVRVRVEGLGRTLRALSQAGADAEDMKTVMHDIGTMIVRGANSPVLTGRLGGSMRAGRAKSRAVVRAGGARIPYAGPIHFGWPAHNIRPNPFLTDSLAKHQGQAVDMLDAGLAGILRKHQLT